MQMSKRSLVKDILWAIVFSGVIASIARFALGLGYTTGLNDASPWGLWIAFKLGFVALAGGGFTLAGMVYIFHLEEFRPILRRAILLALLGYGSFIVSLIFDLGLPWHIYMPMIHWQHHSVMFEIAWCVILYFSVLILEFSPVALEHPWFGQPILQGIRRFLQKVTIPLVVAGIVLSTLHQSSLGSLFLIMPHRVHPLWYSPLIPVLFFVSAIGVGIMALILESFLSSRLYKRDPDIELLERLAKIGGFVLWIYLILRVGDLINRSVVPAGLDGSWQSVLFLSEIILGGVLPASLLMLPKLRRSPEGLITSALLAIFGVVSQRMSLSMFTMFRPEGTRYVPSGLEVIIAFAIPAAAVLIYLFFCENLAIFQNEVPIRSRNPYIKPEFQWNTRVYRDSTNRNTFLRRSGIGVFLAALIVAALPYGIVTGEPMPPTPVQAASGWESMIINGNRNADWVLFPHIEHQNRQLETYSGESEACQTCHHLSAPNDQATPCWQCHQDMFYPTSIFNHRLHQTRLGGNDACGACHVGEHSRTTAKPCVECHDAMIQESGEAAFNYLAPGYKDAMHGACITCHEQKASQVERPDLNQCPTCHYQEGGTTAASLASGANNALIAMGNVLFNRGWTQGSFRPVHSSCCGQ